MHLPPGMEWDDEAVTMMYWARDNNSNITNGTNITDHTFAGATIASPIAMFLCGVIGNLLALLVLHRTRLESQRLMFHSLVAGLVWNDLIGIVLTSPVTVASYINGLQMPGGEHLCRFNGFVMICFGLSTPLIVSAMAIERFLFVKYTFFYTKHCAPGAARFVMLVIWGFVLFFGLLPMFGFGKYVLQYPRTWCFLDFRTSNPVHAAYSYLYSSLNLLLVIVMIVCNLVVVATLARVRDYRRKHSTSSLNSVLIGEGVMEDTQRQQAMARRRKQKDIELQMIVVMCAITTIFAVCWAPLMIYIVITLATKGQTGHVLGLIAVRLASLNQTLNPWLYVILRRALIIRVKKYCCRWRKYLRRKKSHPNPAPVGRRHQYVHVRNQLCHRNNFVGGDINDSLSDSVRKSLQQAIPAAMSLPDVMMVNTGRRDLDIPMPDVDKAQSFGGRVSHSYSMGSVTDCVYCNNPAMAGCAECLRERYTLEKLAKPTREKKDKKVCQEHPKCPNNSNVSEGKQKEIHIGNGQIVFRKENGVHSSHICKNGGSEKDHTTEKSNESTDKDTVIGNKSGQTCPKHSSHAKGSAVHKDVHSAHADCSPSMSKSDSAGKKTGKELFSNMSSAGRSSSLHGRSHDSRLSQHMHKPRNISKSSSSKSSSTKGRPGSRHSTSFESQHHNTSFDKHQGPVEHGTSAQQHNPDHNEVFLNDSRESDDVFDDNIPTFMTRKDTTTTDDGGFSSVPTESLCLSDTGTPGVRTPEKSPLFAPSYGQAWSANPATSGHNALLRNNARPGKSGDTADSGDTSSDSENTQVQKLKLPYSNVPPSRRQEQSRPASKPYRQYSNHRSSADSGSFLLREESDDERSSGIFSSESPARNSKDLGNKPKWYLKKESQSEFAPELDPAHKKQPARRVKSYN